MKLAFFLFFFFFFFSITSGSSSRPGEDHVHTSFVQKSDPSSSTEAPPTVTSDSNEKDEGISQESISPTPSLFWYFESPWFFMQDHSSTSYRVVRHNLGCLPSSVKVLVRARDGPNRNFIFEGTGAQPGDNDLPNDDYGGVIYAWNENYVRLWAPTRAGGNVNGRIISVFDGWGNGINNQQSNTAWVKVIAHCRCC